MNYKSLKQILDVSFHSIFWLWNLMFITVVYIGILPIIGIPLIRETVDGAIPVDFLVTFVALIAIPTVCTVIGAWPLRKQPRELMRLFYGVEAPLFAWCLIRLFLIREFTSVSTLVLGTVLVCILAFAAEVLWGYDANRKSVAWLQLITHNLMLLISIYVGLLLFFYVIPAAGASIQSFFTFHWLYHLWTVLIYGHIIGLFMLLLFGFSITLFLGMPSAFTALYLHSGYRILKAFAGQYGRNRAIQGAVAVVTVWIILFFSLNVQAQVEAFKLLESYPKTNSDRQALIAKSDVIRTGLVNANLFPYRYLSSREDNNHIYAMYKDVFYLPDFLCEFLQNSYNLVMSPFLYNGSRDDVEKAQQLYGEFFDTPLQKAERKAVQHALQSTAIIDQAKAGLLNIDQERVWLRKQEVTLDAHGDWADVEIYEVYENKTTDVEEVLYYFSLPEGAAITGLWLGETDDRNQRFPFQVSPRGAAQQVYNSQVRRVRPVDPALLEQVGPRNYRLRAFPIPRPLSSWERRNGSDRATEMHLWLTYKVMRQEKGWPLPELNEQRNIFWTNRTKRIRNGKVKRGFSDRWLEAYLPANQAQQPMVHQVNLWDGYRISAKPLDLLQKSAIANTNLSTLKNKRFAVILDSSRSMAAQASQVKETFTWLQQQGFADQSLTNNDADLYITDAIDNKIDHQAKRIDDISDFNPAQITFYGSIQPEQMLQQFEQLRGNTPYDGILLVTDQGSYELSEDNTNVAVVAAPLWMVHLGNQLPSAYNDTILKLIQNTGGGVSTDIQGVIQRMAIQEALGSSVVSVADGYAWFMESGTAEITTETGFEPLAARQLILGLSGNLNGSLEELDRIHGIAKTYDIVSPYSSMIVLVNDQQRRMLKEAEASSDRFDREVETGEEQLNQPSNPFTVSGVPEPEVWMLILISAIALLIISRRQKITVDG
ncbi:TIGR02921 family PEP-CTERM protein [Moorena sp. SIO3H5]|uniref:TIGR02921 family PEP-CTERM protein n=1 Tax=Moorena sp. SIO3H5 TaxID=2607834 RepID=UPI0013BD4601|nr:TIGR02921 family PEP-CTERM protein [Moorena sp. SIO3H5]NEO72591.1 TIGR02921 family PEP-CTERM protein [Moorena sp. SIO3H5]